MHDEIISCLYCILQGRFVLRCDVDEYVLALFNSAGVKELAHCFKGKGGGIVFFA